MDTPGVMLPNVPDEQTGMRLALTGMASVNHALIQHCHVDCVDFAQFLYTNLCLDITGVH